MECFPRYLLWAAYVAALAILHGHSVNGQTPDEIEFLHWLHENGVEGVLPNEGKLAITRQASVKPYGGHDEDPQAAEGERGVIALNDFEIGDLVITMPYRVALILSEHDPEPYEGSGETYALIALLLREVAKGNESFWAPYLRILPPTLPQPWLALSPEQYNELQHYPTIRRLEALMVHLRYIYALCNQVAIANASFEQFLWGLAMHMTRHFVLYMPSGSGASPEAEKMYMFMPFGDLFNMHQESEDDYGNVNWEDGVFPDRVELRATRPIPRGTQILEVYGEYPSEDFYLFQAFLPENNFHDTVVLFESMEEAVAWFLWHGASHDWWTLEDPWAFTRALQEARSGAAAALNMEGKDGGKDLALGTDWYLNGGAFSEPVNPIQVGWQWAQSTRVVAGFTAIWRSLAGPAMEFLLGGNDDLLQREGEKFARQALAARCRQLLVSYPTSPGEDEEMLAQAGTGPSEPSLQSEGTEGFGEGIRLAVQFRLLQKAKLQHLIDTV